MLTTFEGNSANAVWIKAYRHIRTNGQHQPGRGGATREILHATLSISDPRQRWILSRAPAINPAFAIAEVVWMINGRNDRKFLSYWNKSLSQFVGRTLQLHGAYGHRLIHHFGFNQLLRASQILAAAPHSRQLVLQIWDPISDFPLKSGKERSRDIPCNVLSMLKVRDQKLEWMQIMRSNDLFRGLPYNLVQFTSMQEIIAGWLGIRMGTFNQVSDSLHVYETAFNDIRIADRRVPANSDSLALPRDQSKKVFSTLGRFIDRLITGTHKHELISHIRNPDLPIGYQNLKLVLAAEHSRKKRWPDLSEDAIARCTNPALTLAWRNWQLRASKPQQ